MSEREGDMVRLQVLGELKRLSDRYPALRVSQLIINAIPSEELQRRENDIYYIEDTDLLRYLTQYERRVEEARSGESTG